MDAVTGRYCLKQIILAEGRDLPFELARYIGLLQLDHGPSLEPRTCHRPPFTVLSSRMLLQVGH